MSTEILYELLKYVLPEELIESFEITNIREENEVFHIYLDECNIVPSEYTKLLLSPNGFYEASTIKDFPLRDKKVVLHVRQIGRASCRERV